jgi:phospholipid transport system substrate-binding protein
MSKTFTTSLLAMLLILAATPCFAAEPTPQEGVQGFIQAIRSMEFPAQDPTSQQALVEKANGFLDLEALSRKALAQHWEKASAEDRQSFLRLMGGLIEQVAYPQSSEFIGSYEITYPEVTPSGNGFEVQSIIKQETEGLEAAVIFHVYPIAGSWKIDDVILDGVSLTEDLQYQFDKIIEESQFAGLLETMQKRLAKAQTENQAS